MTDREVCGLVQRAIRAACAHHSAVALEEANLAVEAWRMAEEARREAAHKELLFRAEWHAHWALASAAENVRVIPDSNSGGDA